MCADGLKLKASSGDTDTKKSEFNVRTPMEEADPFGLRHCDRDLIHDRRKGCSLFNTKGKDIVKMEAKKCATLLFAALFAILFLATGCKHGSSSEDEDLVGDGSNDLILKERLDQALWRSLLATRRTSA